MKKYFSFLAIALLVFCTGCSKTVETEPVDDTQIVYVDENLKDEIPKMMENMSGLWELRYADFSNPAIMDEILNHPNRAVIMRNSYTVPEGLMSVCRGTLYNDVIVTFAAPLDGLFQTGGFVVGYKTDDSALRLIEKVKDKCGSSAVERMEKTFEKVCLNFINDIQMHIIVYVSTYNSQDLDIKRFGLREFVFPASDYLDVVLYVNESSPYRFASKLKEEFFSSGEMFNELDFVLPPSVNYSGTHQPYNSDSDSVLPGNSNMIFFQN